MLWKHFLEVGGGALVGGFLVFLWENATVQDLRRSLLAVHETKSQVTGANVVVPTWKV